MDASSWRKLVGGGGITISNPLALVWAVAPDPLALAGEWVAYGRVADHTGCWVSRSNPRKCRSVASSCARDVHGRVETDESLREARDAWRPFVAITEVERPGSTAAAGRG